MAQQNKDTTEVCHMFVQLTYFPPLHRGRLRC
jgi:hypothetical protein